MELRNYSIEIFNVIVQSAFGFFMKVHNIKKDEEDKELAKRFDNI